MQNTILPGNDMDDMGDIFGDMFGGMFHGKSSGGSSRSRHFTGGSSFGGSSAHFGGGSGFGGSAAVRAFTAPISVRKVLTSRPM